MSAARTGRPMHAPNTAATAVAVKCLLFMPSSSNGGSVTKRLLCIPVQSTHECKTRREERGPCPPRGEANAHNAPSMPEQDTLPCAFVAVLDRNLCVTLPCPSGRVLREAPRPPPPRRKRPPNASALPSSFPKRPRRRC